MQRSSNQQVFFVVMHMSLFTSDVECSNIRLYNLWPDIDDLIALIDTKIDGLPDDKITTTRCSESQGVSQRKGKKSSSNICPATSVDVPFYVGDLAVMVSSGESIIGNTAIPLGSRLTWKGDEMFSDSCR